MTNEKKWELEWTENKFESEDSFPHVLFFFFPWDVGVLIIWV